jgi:oxygen-independent coproporphyrinogen-3 oxidase
LKKPWSILKRNPGLKKISSLYIHIPFCLKKCIYCDFFSVHYNEASAEKYTDALCKELVRKKDLASTLTTIYVGGGTPSLLPSGCFQELFRYIKDTFHLSPDIEITVEVNPGTLDEVKVNALLSLGVNRVSLGVQSFSDSELKTLGRIHDARDAVRSIELIKKTGITNYSIDLIYGIPGQTMESWKHSISAALEFPPAHISAYELTPEKGTPLYEAIETGKLKMLDEELILEMYDCAIDHLAIHGYEHYEISNFALPGLRCVHNINYWERGEYIGSGAGAHSFINNTRSRNIKDIEKYIEGVNKGTLPETESTRLSAEDALKEFIFLGLRKREGINLDKKGQVSQLLMNDDTGFHNALLRASEELIEEGLVEIDRDYLRLTRKGIVLSNAVIVRLFENLGL